ncbi:MAG: DUF2924 domain-containing protein [Proteobacteria bacterium]|nr:DUF2924 domain-containing protein [Pseudomonadota bacterium]
METTYLEKGQQMTTAQPHHAIETLKTRELRAKFEQVLGKATRSNNRTYLIGQIVKALEKAQAEQAAARKTRRSVRQPGQRDPRLPKPGSFVTREYQGTTIEVTVGERDFQYAGKTYRSLSTIAREVTGTIWNGFLFFKLTPYPSRKAAAR